MIRNIFASIILLFILLITPLLSMLCAAFETYLNPDFYQKEEVLEETYDAAISYGSAILQTYIAQSGNPDLFTENEIKEQLEKLITLETFSDINKDLFSQISQSPLPDQIIMDLTKIKETLPEAIREVANEYVEKLEPCTEEELMNISTGIQTVPTCIPEGISKEEITNSIAGIESSDTYKNIPPQLSFDLSTLPAQPKMLIEFMIQKNNLIRAILIALFVIPTLLMGLIIFKPFKSVLRWIGNAFFWGGLPLLFMNMTIDGTVKVVTTNIAAQNPNIDLTQYEQTTQFITTIIKFLTGNMVFHGIVMVSIGVALFILSLLISRKNDDIK